MTAQVLGVVGAGAVVQNFYLPTLAKLEPSEWRVVLYDVDVARAKAVADKIGADAAAWTGAPDRQLDAAIVATPPRTHLTVSTTLLSAGAHVLCEKPLVLYTKEAEELVALARRQGRVLAVNQTRRMYPNSRMARALIASREIGDVQRVHLQEANRFNWPSKSGFYFEPGRNGVLADRGSHAFDILGWILGETLTPTAALTDGYRGSEATALVDFEGRTLTGSCLLGWLVDLPNVLEIVGSEGSILIDDNWNRLRIRRGAKERMRWARKRTADFSDLAAPVLADFFGACVGGASQLDAASVVPSIQFLDEAYRIARADWPSEILEVA